jgi:hypothetical protein
LRKEQTLQLAFLRRGELQLRVQAGRVPPGQHRRECYLVAAGSRRVLHLHSNPWSFLPAVRDSRFPPLLDTRVVPLALQRQPISRIVWNGPLPESPSEMVRRDITDPEYIAEHRRPGIEWYLKTEDSDPVRLNDAAAFEYVTFAGDIRFDELIGDRQGRDDLFHSPALTVTFHYNDEAHDTLVVSTAGKNGHRFLLNETTSQVFLVPSSTAERLVPDMPAWQAPRVEPEAVPR